MRHGVLKKFGEIKKAFRCRKAFLICHANDLKSGNQGQCGQRG